MTRQANTHGGGAATNAHGLYFEQETSLCDALRKNGYTVNNDGKVFLGNEFIGYCLAKSKFVSFLAEQCVDISVNSHKLLPDDALINYNNNTVYIIEKKFQHGGGSVDEKLQTCGYKKQQYGKLVSQIGFYIEYLYVLNDWFAQPRYNDVFDYIHQMGCHYFFNHIPLDFLGL